MVNKLFCMCLFLSSCFKGYSVRAYLGAKYLVIVSSRSLKMREFSFAQFDNFLRKMCLFFNF